MQALRNRRGLALLLAGGVTLLAAGASYAQDTSGVAATDGAADQAGADTSRTADDSTARNANQRCLSRFGPDLVGAFERDRNDEPVNADNVDLMLTLQAEPINVPC